MKNTNEKISVILKKVGVSPALLGYKYASEAIRLVLEDRSFIDEITKRLYPCIATKFGTTVSRVERGIRHGVETAFYNMTPDAKKAVFGNTANGGKVTNSAFIATLAELILTEPNNIIWNL
jgi:two-component system response regulator (stage 0 sporulation protein A)